MRVEESAKDDLKWFLAILVWVKLNNVLLDRFAQIQAPSVDFYMDVSDCSMCALFPQQCEFIKFSSMQKSWTRL